MDKDFQDKIDEYVLGRMSAEDRMRFEKEICWDDDKRKQLKFTQNIKRAVCSREEKLRQMEKMRHYYSISAVSPVAIDDYDARVSCEPRVRVMAKKKMPVKRIWLWASGIAAVLVVGYFIWAPLKYESDILPPSEMMRGDDGIFDVEVSEANDTISSRDSVKVIKEEKNNGTNE